MHNRVVLEPAISLMLRLSGACVLEQSGKLETLGRRSMALLAYLALEGVTPRSKLAGLLWADVGEERARANLRQEIYRVNQVGALIENDRFNVWLAKNVESDLAQFDELNGEFAQGLEIDDAPDIMDWLYTQRESLSEQRRAKLEGQFKQLEQAGSYRQAAVVARKLVALEPLSEAAHVRMLRCLYLSDDRTGVRAGILELRRLLKEELGVEPLPETTAMLESLEAGQLQASTPSKRPSIPLNVLRPPRLAGVKALRAMVQGLERGKAVFVEGEAGAGKSRLLHDLAASRSALGGHVLEVRARESDQSLAFAPLITALRELWEAGFRAEVEPIWQLEASRLLPELRPNSNLEGLVQVEVPTEAKARFLEGLTRYVLAFTTGGGLVILDDLHWADSATLEFLAYAAPRILNEQVGILGGYRPLEVSSNLRNLIGQLEREGLAVTQKLEALELPEVRELLFGIDPKAAALSEPMHAATGGNPLFVVETLKHLLETGQLDANFQLFGQLRPPERIGALLKNRLERLETDTRRVLACLAVAGADFSASLAGTVLELPELRIAEGLGEAEVAQVITPDPSFTHDLLRTTTLELTPSSVRQTLHRLVAQELELRQAAPSRIAAHLIQAGQPSEAVVWLIAASEIDLETFLPQTALERLNLALMQALSPNLEAQVRTLRARALTGVRRATEAEAEANLALELAKKLGRPDLERRANLALSGALIELARPAEAAKITRLAMQDLSQSTEFVAHEQLGFSLMMLGDFEAASLEFTAASPESTDALFGRAITAWHVGEFSQMLELAHSVQTRELPDFKRARFLNLEGIGLWTLGRFHEAEQKYNQAIGLCETNQPLQAVAIYLSRSSLHISMGELNKSIKDVELAVKLEELAGNTSNLADAIHQKACIHYLCGDYVQALELIDDAIERWFEPGAKAYTTATKAVIQSALGRNPTITATSALEMARESRHTFALALTLRACAEVALYLGQPKQALEYASELKTLSRKHGMLEQLGYAHLYSALAGETKYFNAALELSILLPNLEITWRAAQGASDTKLAVRTLEGVYANIPEHLRSFWQTSKPGIAYRTLSGSEKPTV
jgi:DNA-binding SARP family transcriptional activator/tetratricopeptide (TPR) repeat protein